MLGVILKVSFSITMLARSCKANLEFGPKSCSNGPSSCWSYCQGRNSCQPCKKPSHTSGFSQVLAVLACIVSFSVQSTLEQQTGFLSVFGATWQKHEETQRGEESATSMDCVHWLRNLRVTLSTPMYHQSARTLGVPWISQKLRWSRKSLKAHHGSGKGLGAVE